MERDDRNLGDPIGSFRKGGRACREVESRPKADWESDQLIVLGDGKADHVGKGLTGIRSLQRKHEPNKEDRTKPCKPHCGE